MVGPAVVNQMRAKLAAGEVVTAFMVTMPSVAMAQVLAASGVDCLIIDMEHGPIDLTTVHAMVAATQDTQATPIVRIPWTEHWLAKPVLDTGAMGINFPMISTPEMARAAVAALRYPPEGVRGSAPSYAALRWGLSPPEYIKRANREILNVITIEDPDAVRNLDAILVVPGIDAVAIASFDLSMSLGVPGQFDHPDVRALVAEAEAKVLRSGIPMGGVALTPEAARAKRAAGYRMLLVGFDVQMVDGAARAAVASAQG
ncbi:MAG: 2,4-dihydroxyhept-2-ene-1,7-dioic acid aldolase [Alphaproteobacteria bacterium]|nr:2,4-dihydroxyhept-2-ene-1,7-dioic acid aldolase [Alphaproteobacteria bacterium]